MLILTPQEEWAQKFLAASMNPTGALSKYFLWVNTVNHHSLRLEWRGFQWITVGTTIPHWNAVMAKPPSLSVLLKLERAMTSPYFIHNTETLKVFDPQHSAMIALHSGDIERYLDNMLG